MLKIKHSSQEGRTIIETLAYIMLMITITASIAAAVSKSYYRYECSAIQQDLVDLHKVITKHYAIDGQYSKVRWNDLCEDSLGPKSMMPERICEGEGEEERCRCKHEKGRHIFDGDVNIGPSDCDTAGHYCSTFYIEFKNLTRDICAQLGTKSWATVSGSDLERLVINQTVWHWEYSPLKDSSYVNEKNLPATINSVSEACRDGYSNTIRWYFN